MAVMSPRNTTPEKFLSPSAGAYSADSPFSEIQAQSARISAMSTAAARRASSFVQAASNRARGSPHAFALPALGSALAVTPSSIPGSVMKRGYCARRTASSNTWGLNVAPRRRARVSAATLAQAASSTGLGS